MLLYLSKSFFVNRLSLIKQHLYNILAEYRLNQINIFPVSTLIKDLLRFACQIWVAHVLQPPFSHLYASDKIFFLLQIFYREKGTGKSYFRCLIASFYNILKLFFLFLFYINACFIWTKNRCILAFFIVYK